MSTTNYIWDVATDSYLMETDETDAATAVYTNEPVQFGNLVSQRRDSTTSYCHFDNFHSTRELTDATENVVGTNLYNAWGVNLSSTGTIENPFCFTGELGYYFDAEMDHNYVRARTYQPARARWQSMDPLGFLNGSSQYAYVLNLPTNYVDPSGLLHCYCDGRCTFPKGAGFETVINEVVNKQLGSIIRVERKIDSSPPECPLSNNPSGGFRRVQKDCETISSTDN